MNEGRNILARFAEKMAPQGATEHVRPDMYLADWDRAGRDSAKLLVGWAQTLDRPTNEALDTWVLENFQGQLKLAMSTLRLYPEKKLLTCVVSKLLPTRRLADADSLARISPNRWVEVKGETKHVWEVREGDDGSKHLVMLQDNNLDELLEERRKALRVRKGSVPTFDAIRSAGAGELDADVGDKVSFFYRGLLHEGLVVGFKEGKTKIHSGDQYYSVDAAAIVDTVQKDPATLDDQKDRIKQYWRKIFPADYVKKWLGDEK